MDLINMYRSLEHAGMDERSGIKIERVTGDEQFSLYIAEILPQTWLKPHYHLHDIEIYQILEGAGIMRIGSRGGDSLVWEEEFPVGKGDCFTIPEGTVHQIGNMTDQALIACFTCPPSHLGDDRFFMLE